MKQRNKYIAPTVLRSVLIEMESEILSGGGSVVTPNTKIDTAGQTVETKSFDADGFNSVWE